MIRVLRRSSYEAPAKEEPNDEDEIPCRSAAGRAAACYSACRSGASARQPNRGARGRGSVLELCLRERPGSKAVRRADVGLRQPQLRLAIQECVLKPTCLPALRQIAGHPSGNRESIQLEEVMMQVGDVLRSKTSRVVTVRMNETVAVAARLMRANDIGALVVKDVVRTECNTAVGMITEHDVVRAVAEHGSAGPN